MVEFFPSMWIQSPVLGKKRKKKIKQNSTMPIINKKLKIIVKNSKSYLIIKLIIPRLVKIQLNQAH
jgi:hypothetical protein